MITGMLKKRILKVDKVIGIFRIQDD